MPVFVSYLGVVNTHTQFFPSFSVVYHQNEQKNWVMKNVCAFTRTQRKKEGRIYTRIENGSSSIGIKKSRGEREEEIEQASSR